MATFSETRVKAVAKRLTDAEEASGGIPSTDSTADLASGGRARPGTRAPFPAQPPSISPGAQAKIHGGGVANRWTVAVEMSATS